MQHRGWFLTGPPALWFAVCPDFVLQHLNRNATEKHCDFSQPRIIMTSCNIATLKGQLYTSTIYCACTVVWQTLYISSTCVSIVPYWSLVSTFWLGVQYLGFCLSQTDMQIKWGNKNQTLWARLVWNKETLWLVQHRNIMTAMLGWCLFWNKRDQNLYRLSLHSFCSTVSKNVGTFFLKNRPFWWTIFEKKDLTVQKV